MFSRLILTAAATAGLALPALADTRAVQSQAVAPAHRSTHATGAKHAAADVKADAKPGMTTAAPALPSATAKPATPSVAATTPAVPSTSATARAPVATPAAPSVTTVAPTVPGKAPAIAATPAVPGAIRSN